MWLLAANSRFRLSYRDGLRDALPRQIFVRLHAKKALPSTGQLISRSDAIALAAAGERLRHSGLVPQSSRHASNSPDRMR